MCFKFMGDKYIYNSVESLFWAMAEEGKGRAAGGREPKVGQGKLWSPKSFRGIGQVSASGTGGGG